MSDAKALIEKLPQAFDPEAAGDMQATIQFAVSTPMYATIENGACAVSEGEADNADLTIKMDDGDLVDMLTGELNAMTAFMTGKLQVDGDIMLAQKVSSIFDSNRLS